MGGTTRNGPQRSRSRFRIIAPLLGIALVASQALGVVAAGAITDDGTSTTAVTADATTDGTATSSATDDATATTDGGVDATTDGDGTIAIADDATSTAGGDATTTTADGGATDTSTTTAATGGGSGSRARDGARAGSRIRTAAGTPDARTSLNVDLDQYANEDAAWQNGDLNGSNSAYNEGDVVPFRLALEGLSPGSHTIHINYDFTAGGTEAYDFLATWNVTEHPGLCDAGGGAVSSMCPALGTADTRAFPSDPFQPNGHTQAGLTVAGAEAASGVSRQLTMYGGTITSITGPTHAGPTGNNSTGDFVVTFDKVGADGAALLAWGGHLAESAYWKTTGGGNNGASQISGAPWHMRTQNLDGSGNKNQDRSIQPSAIVPLPGLEISKSASSAEVTTGETFTYTVTVTNTGDAAASPVLIADDLDDSLTNVSATYDVDPGSGQDGACTVGAGNTIACPASGTISLAKSDGDTVAPENDVVAVTVTATAPAGSCPTVLNTASASIGNGTPVTSNQVTVNVTGCTVDLTLTKTSDVQGPAEPGDTASFTIDVTNDGTISAHQVTVTDSVPAGLDITSASFTGGSNGPADCDVTGREVTCDVGSLAPGASATVTIDVDVTTGACPSITNTASVTGSNETAGTGNNTDSAAFDVACPLGIQILKDGPALAHVGETVTYTLDVSLTTQTPLTNITVTDPICDGPVTPVSKTGGNVNDVLEPGEVWSYSCDHVVQAGDPDPLPNTATVEGTDAQGRPASDTDDHVVDVIHPAIRVVKTANPLSISPGQTVTYRYAVTNTGDVTLFGVSVDDDKLGHICDIAELAVDETRTCTMDFTAGDGNLGPITNVAVAQGEDETGYPVKDDDDAQIDVVLGTTVTPPPTTTPPSGTAFTGSDILPLAVAALVLLVLGSGLTYLGRREDGSSA